MKRNVVFFCSTLFILISAFSSCNRSMPKFARWELDSLKEISPSTPVSTLGIKGSEITAKWFISVYAGGYTGEHFENGSSVYRPNESKLDSAQYIVFNTDGSFILSAKNPCPEMKKELKKLFPEIHPSNDIIQGTYKCYDADWYGGECDGSYGVVLYDTQGREINRFAFSYCALDGEDFQLSSVYMKDPYRDDISSKLSFFLHKNFQ